MSLSDQVAALESAIPALTAKKVDTGTFASSLVKQFKAKGSLSDKQAYWVDKLVSEVAEAAKPKIQMVAPGAWDAFQSAVPAEAKKPAVILVVKGAGALRIDRKFPASKYLRICHQPVAEGSKPRSGKWSYVAALRADDSVSFTVGLSVEKRLVLATLEEFGEDMIAALKFTGLTWGICANCGRLLTHPASVAFGIGPVCSAYLGLGAQYAATAALIAGSAK